MSSPAKVPSVSVGYARTGASARVNELGMRPMQQRAYEQRGEQYLLIKSPPASGKSRALMFVALDKLERQGVRQALIVVPERAIGASFNNAALTASGFWADWRVPPRWNLCNAPGGDDDRAARSKVAAVGQFLASEDRVLVCTHATFRFAVDELGTEAFDDRLIAIDEFHHVSANPQNRLGSQLGALMERDRLHLVAMTGSYFRGDAEAVLSPAQEARFATVTYTYYEQLDGYEHLKSLDIGYYFYSGPYVDAIAEVLDPRMKTIVHIPNVNSRESMKDKYAEVERVIDALGTWQERDEATGFHLVRTDDGRLLRVADLVDPDQREPAIRALKDPATNRERDRVDVIIALGMAKEGFDWIWCEHALTVGYRSSLTEIVQIIGRATRDAPGKARARFTNLIAEPDASEDAVADAVNDTLKAIAASLLMEQVLAPRFDFTPKQAGPKEGFDYGESGYDEFGTNVGHDPATGTIHIEIGGLATPSSEAAAKVCRDDLNELVHAFLQDRTALERGLFDDETLPEDLTQIRMGKIVAEHAPDLDESDQEAVRQHAIAALALVQQGLDPGASTSSGSDVRGGDDDDDAPSANTALIDGIRRFAMNVTDLDVDLIDRINPFGSAYRILSRAMNDSTLKQVAAAIAAKRITLSVEEAYELAKRAARFKRERGRLPELTSQDPWEQRLAQGVAVIKREQAKHRAT